MSTNLLLSAQPESTWLMGLSWANQMRLLFQALTVSGTVPRIIYLHYFIHSVISNANIYNGGHGSPVSRNQNICVLHLDRDSAHYCQIQLAPSFVYWSAAMPIH